MVELDVEIVNIVDNEGNVRMSLFKSDRIPDPIIAGETVDRSGIIPASGMLSITTMMRFCFW